MEPSERAERLAAGRIGRLDKLPQDDIHVVGEVPAPPGTKERFIGGDCVPGSEVSRARVRPVLPDQTRIPCQACLDMSILRAAAPAQLLEAAGREWTRRT